MYNGQTGFMPPGPGGNPNVVPGGPQMPPSHGMIPSGVPQGAVPPQSFSPPPPHQQIPQGQFTQSRY